MSRAAQVARPAGAKKRPARRRFNVDEYYRMAEVGIFGPDERVELLEGDVYEMAPIGSSHAQRVDFLTEWLVTRLAGHALVRVQGPVRLSSGNEPEPDVAVLRPPRSRYDRGHPGPADVFLVIEVADSSLAHDRDLKARIYAEAGIPELWIVDLTSNQVLVHRNPAAGQYDEITSAARGGMLSPAAFPDLALPVSELLPE